MSELRQPINSEGGSLIMQMLAQTVQGKMQSYHKRHGEAQLLQSECPLSMESRNCRKRPALGLQRAWVGAWSLRDVTSTSSLATRSC